MTPLRITACLLSLLVLAPPDARAGEEGYADPILAPSTRLGNYLGLELGKAGAQDGADFSSMGLSAELLASESASWRFAFGRQRSVPTPYAQSLSNRIGISFKGLRSGDESWFVSHVLFDYSKRQFEFDDEARHGFEFGFGFTKGSWIMDGMTDVEFFWAFEFQHNDLTDPNPPEGRMKIPFDLKFSREIMPGIHVVGEGQVRVDLWLKKEVESSSDSSFFGEGSDEETTKPQFQVPVDLAAGLRFVTGDVVLGAAFHMAMRHENWTRRGGKGLVLTAAWAAF